MILRITGTLSTRLCGALIAPQVTAPDGCIVLTHGDREIHVLGVYPLHEDEMRLKLEQGTGASTTCWMRRG